MTARPQADLKPNTREHESIPLVEPLVKPLGFREYDARWRFEREINLPGMRAVGLGLGTLLHERAIRPTIAVGHDYRAYSSTVKQALTTGLLGAGCTVYDIGLALTPMAYFSQAALKTTALAMVTASHNENGWTGIKIGAEFPLTFGPDEMNALKDIVLGGRWSPRSGGALRVVTDMARRYIGDLTERAPLKRRLKAVIACGNGTAGVFAPRALDRIGCEVVTLNCTLDHSFPHHNPDPENMNMLEDLGRAVVRAGADIGFAFDGDGDRCGVVDETGKAISADKIGVLLARELSACRHGARVVVDVKSTRLFLTDPVLRKNNARIDYWKTGHSHIKRRCQDIDAIAGFEKSGHFVFRPPFGRGYDDAILAAMAICDLLERHGDTSLSRLYRTLPATWASATMSPACPDERKYQVVDSVLDHYRRIEARSGAVAGQSIKEIMTINGVRLTLSDGTWGLVRASSNQPRLVVVCESPRSRAAMTALFRAIDAHLSTYREIGEYNQKL